MASERTSVIGGTLRMLFFLVLLFWVPVLGPLAAGFLGGKESGGVGKAILSFLLSAGAVGALLYFFSASITGIPFIGFVIGSMGAMLFLVNGGALLVGGIIGGALA